MAKMRVMHSMELDDESKLDYVLPMPMDKPDYPCGLRISLTQDELDKLELDHKDAVVGGMFHGHFMARVTGVFESEGSDGPCCRIEAQITDLDIESEDEENAEE